MKPYFAYILQCADGTLYCGITTDVERRVREHNGLGAALKNGGMGRGSPLRGARYTATRRPVALVYAAPFPDRSSASREEHRIKKLTRSEKIELIKTVKN
jgi:putative endonuclease